LVGVDVLHRPFQPQRRIDIDDWRKVAHRVVLSILDVIAYRNGAYHGSGSEWLAYRDAVRTTLAAVDAAIVISADVKQQVLLERLPIDPERIHVVELGTDHVTGIEEERVPDELVERGFVADEFLVVLGATYAHKNRDQAIRAVRELRSGGRNLGLVLVGAAVPHGSSRRQEAVALEDDPGRWLFSIPDVSAEERNWLLRHAAAVLYPTSAEGFGLIPFEAAQLGTPTVCVPFGPLPELVPQLPVSAEGWSAGALAAAVRRVTSDPVLAREQVKAVLAAGGQFTWRRSTAKLVGVYRDVLARPSR
jgi:glycosyltransferase involved in cell wall biosynthesis